MQRSLKRKYNKKPWRRFTKPSCVSGAIRKVCLAALILETAFFLKNISSAITYEEKESRQVLLTEGMEREPAPASLLERYFGIRFRFKEGEIEFYHKEEKTDFLGN